MQIIDAPSPNFDQRDRDVDMIILHYTGMQSGEAALERLRDERAKVSAHYLVEEDGRIFHLVNEDDRAWHAGRASWKGESDINARSVGVEIVNPGHEWGYRDFPDAQIEAVVSLVAAIADRRQIDRTRVLGHADVAPRRKEDPGERFPWARLAQRGLAIGPYEGAPDPSVSFDDAAAALVAIGYDAPPADHGAALVAFHRRFAPAALGKGWSPLTKAALVWARAQMAP